MLTENYITTPGRADALHASVVRNVKEKSVDYDVEGWYRCLNHKASRAQLSMYMLLQLLGNETELLEVQLTLLKESSHIRRQRESSRRVT